MTTEHKDCLTILEARLPGDLTNQNNVDLVGYGRDWDEARSHAGFDDPPSDLEQFSEVSVINGDCTRSKEIAELICRFHIEEDEEIPIEVKNKLANLLASSQFVLALQFCFEMIWDRGFEQ